MDFEMYTERSRGFIQTAQSMAARANHQQMTPEHVLQVLLQDQEGMAADLLAAADADPKSALEGVSAELKRLPTVEGSGAGQVYLSTETTKLFGQAEEAAEKYGDSYVTAEMLLMALTLMPGTGAHKVLADCGLTPQKLNHAANQR